MSGFGRRNYLRFDAKTKTTQMIELELSTLKERGCFDQSSPLLLRWWRRDEEIAAVRLRIREFWMELDYHHKKEQLKYNVKFDWTDCHLGGRRRWFLCPLNGCGKRVAVLYGGRVFACRGCHQLSYPSQSENRWQRALKRADKARDRSGWTPGLGNGTEPRPKGSHRRTYEKNLKLYKEAQTSFWSNLPVANDFESIQLIKEQYGFFD